MATTIVTKSGSGAPTASDLVAGELAVDLTNKRLYTEDSGGTVLEVGSNPYNFTANHDGSAKLATTATGIQVTGDIANASGDLTLDVAGDIILDAGGSEIRFSKAGTEFGKFATDIGTPSQFAISSSVLDGDIKLKGNDGGSTITALTLDMSEAGEATFNAGATFGSGIDVTGSVTADGLTVDGAFSFGTSVDGVINSPAALYLNFDSDNNSAGEVFVIGSNRASGSGGNEHFRVDASGNVGIGASSPSSYPVAPNLVVDAGTNGGITIKTGSTNYGGLYFADGTTGNEQYRGFIQYNHDYVGSTDSLLLGTAGAEKMRIDSSGNVGINNSNPSAFDTLGGKYLVVGNGVNTSNLTLFSDDTADGNGYGHVAFADSAVSSSTAQYAGLIQYYHGEDSMRFYTNATEKMRIDASGNLLVGVSAASAKLEVGKAANGSESDADFNITTGGYTGHHWLDANAYYIGQNSAIRSLRIYSSAETAGVNLAAGGTSWGTFSDERLKYDVEPIENALESLSNLRTVKYRLADVDAPDSQKKLGLIAQDLVGVLDEVIDPLKRTGDETEYMSVRYTEMVPVLVKAIQEQQATIEALTARIAALES